MFPIKVMSKGSQTFMIGQINLQSNQPSSEIGAPSIKLPQKIICSQCTFEKTVELSQEILQLRNRIVWFEDQTKLLETISSMEDAKINELIIPLRNAVQKEVQSETEAEKQLKYLEAELASLDDQLDEEEKLQVQFKQKIKNFSEQNKILQQNLFRAQLEWKQLTKYYHEFILQKQRKLQQCLNIFQMTNFVSILYSITFEDNRSFLNGQKIIHSNTWKIVQIILFYQTKYSETYHPLYHIFWSQMKLQRDPDQHPYEEEMILTPANLTRSVSRSLLKSINLGSLLRKESAREVNIQCDSEEKVLNVWMCCYLLEVRQLFGFLVKEAGRQASLRYEITKDGQFELLRGKDFKNNHERFNLTIKYLMTDIDQINNLEFFSREKRVNSQ